MDAPSAPPPPGDAHPTDRRSFLAQSAATATIAWFWWEGVGNPLRRLRLDATPPGAPRASLSAAEWSALEAATERILPSGPDSPGAREVNAVGYLDALLADPEIEEETVERIRRGAGELDEFARTRGATRFAALPAEAQDEGIRGFESPYERSLWLRNLISFTLEAFLGDPVHGGNVDETGWTWARHVPGKPRPAGPWRPVGEGPKDGDGAEAGR